MQALLLVLFLQEKLYSCNHSFIRINLKVTPSKRFKDRHGIRVLSVQGESLSAAEESVGTISAENTKKMSLTLSQIF